MSVTQPSHAQLVAKKARRTHVRYIAPTTGFVYKHLILTHHLAYAHKNIKRTLPMAEYVCSKVEAHV